MKLSLNWLKQFVDIPSSSAKELSDIITLHIAEVDDAIDLSEAYNHMVVGQIQSIQKHPNADSLYICQVNLGKTNLPDSHETIIKDSQKNTIVQIVCGGSNLFEGQLVAVALPRSQVKWHGEGDLITLSATKIRGEYSYGMICASEEIGMGKSKGSEIMDLTDTKATPGTPLAQVFQIDDIIFDIDNKAITHRPDLWGHYGFARELAAYFKLPLKPYQDKSLDLKLPESGTEIDLHIEDTNTLLEWNSIIIDNISIQESPKWLQQKLESVDIRPVNNIVDITNYIMHEYGQPMHAYDYSVFESSQTTIRFAKENETLETLDHKQRQLTTNDPILITNNDQNPLIILGVMGGVNSEVSNETSSILLESACFDPIIIRKSSTHHGLRSDASQRFEKSLDPAQCLPALHKAIQLIQEICPEATLKGPITHKKLFEYPTLTLDLELTQINQYLGIELSAQEVINILTSLEFKVTGTTQFKVTVPSFRATKDIQNSTDLIEEIARMYGYENIPSDMPSLPMTSPTKNFDRDREHNLRALLSALGHSEVLNYSFYSKEDIQKSLLNAANHLQLQNFLSKDQSHLRTTLLPNLLKTVYENLKQFNSLHFFEIGKTYIDTSDFYPTEDNNLALIHVGSKIPYLELKGALDQILPKLSTKKIRLQVLDKPSIPQYYHPNKTISLIIDKDTVVGYIGIIHPLVQENFKIETEIAFAEINLDLLPVQEVNQTQFKEINKFPGIQFDLSILIPSKTYSQTLHDTLKKSSPLITNVELFDIYEGDSLPKDHKALAYTIYLQATDRTLTDQDLEEVQSKCIKNIQKIGGEIRG